MIFVLVPTTAPTSLQHRLQFLESLALESAKHLELLTTQPSLAQVPPFLLDGIGIDR